MTEPNHATVGCAFASDDAIVAAMRKLSDDGMVSAWRVGAVDKERAARIALAAGAANDLDPLDPFAGVQGVASGPDATYGVNRGAVVGGVAGALAGLAAGPTSVGALMPVDPQLRTLAAALLFFAVGVAAGGVLGGAFGKRPSTHAGFQLIDAMEAGGVAAIGLIEPARIDDVRRVLGEGGAAEIVVISH
ncbi:MAG TPA: hypothetical protein VEV38_10600 [Candidatus Eremiobacteraceae bacterium]|nr:hypothetical protein [Candidatus Eremiobacteraceae bacterium]